MRAFPPAAPDQAYQQCFAPLGLLDPAPPYAGPPAELTGALTAGTNLAKQRMESALASGNLSPVVNGWTLTFHSFDYNLDHLGLGTIGDPAWEMADRQASYLGRALAARGGLWGQSDRPVLHRRPDTGSAPGQRRLAHHRDPA